MNEEAYSASKNKTEAREQNEWVGEGTERKWVDGENGRIRFLWLRGIDSF